ncbi:MULTISPECIES: hypothetical protein [Lonsdalea]|uniref:Uncharacterized protein n=2 Tax=Lonsdalea TaxID=1082702 RepID=A0ACD1JD88_9GAMM|nr:MULTISPECIES: hypothetical protein [Lonsdalea]OSM96069.1 hypothetical protein AU508_09455 [Lonsdalea populi]OSN01485.1 hypothetical protein AU499_06265 [Lonsdalea populi]QPQ22814.1 hypothetical protein I6N93_08835 [Lonsdalea populi]RAT14088.1 hypothetical protein AU485_07045 [Lonsdalea quercina]RAT18036.1 hypothetical protein AU486_02690 [Lonsdalea quercina]
MELPTVEDEVTVEREITRTVIPDLYFPAKHSGKENRELSFIVRVKAALKNQRLCHSKINGYFLTA